MPEDIIKIEDSNSQQHEINSKITRGIVKATLDSSSTSTAFVATASNVTELYDGLAILLKNTVVTSASGCTLNLNQLGAKRIYTTYDDSVSSTGFALNGTYLFIFDYINDRWQYYSGLPPVPEQTGTYANYNLCASPDGSNYQIKEFILIIENTSLSNNVYTGDFKFGVVYYRNNSWHYRVLSYQEMTTLPTLSLAPIVDIQFYIINAIPIDGVNYSIYCARNMPADYGFTINTLQMLLTGSLLPIKSAPSRNYSGKYCTMEVTNFAYAADTDYTASISFKLHMINLDNQVPTYGLDTTKFLRNDGTWVVPDNTDTKVTQTSTTNNANYEVLFSGTADNTTRTESARKTDKLKFNPSTELLTVTKEKIAHTAYGVSSGKTTGTPKETILKTGIKWVTGKHMPVVHITGYAYGLKSPVEFKIGFYIYHDVIGWCGVTNMGAWAPDVYLFKYTRDSENYVAIGFAGQCYFLQLQADVQDEMGALEYINLANANWSWEFLTTTGNIPTPDSGVTCIKVPYQANILNPSKVNGHTVETDVPSGAVFTDTWRPTVICENSEAPTGTMLNNERVDYRGGDNVELVHTQEHWTVGSTVHSKDVVTFNSPDTTYTLGTSGNNITLTPSSGTAQSITTPYATNSKIAGGIVRAILDDAQTTATSFIATAQGITELYDGLTIIMKNTKITSATNWVINLNDLGGKAVYNSKTNSRMTTGYELNTEYLFVFDYANDYWVMQVAYYENNSNTIGEYAGSVVADENGAIFDNSIVLQTQLNPPRWSSITNKGGTSTSKQPSSLGFLPNGNIICATTSASAGETIGQNHVWWLTSNSIRYWTNCGTSTLPTTAVGKSIYIKCTMNNGLLYIADAPWWAVDLPTINDGYYYYYVGNMYSRYQCTIAPNHPIYYHNGEKIIEYTDNKVLQTTDSATNSNYPILFSDSTTSDNITSGTKKSSSLYYNPYNQELSSTSLKAYDHLNVDNYAWIDVTTWTKDLYFHRNSNGDTRYIQSIGDDGNGGERTDTLLAITDNNTVIASNLLKKATNEWTFIDETGFDVTGASGIVPVSNYTNYSELMVIVYITNVSSTDCYKGSHIIPLTSGGTLPGPSATECIFGGYYYSSSYLLNYALNCSTSGTTYNISWRDGWFTMKPNPSSDNKYNIKVYAR